MRPVLPVGPLRTRVSYGPRKLSMLPAEGLGEAVWPRLEEAAEKGFPRAAVLGVSADHVEQYDLPPIARAGHDVRRFIAAVAGQPGMEVVGVLGTLGLRRGRAKPEPALVAFFEWPDGRWWFGTRLFFQGRLRDDWPPNFLRAEEGHGRPNGLGGWWSLARVEGLRLNPPGADDPAN